MALERKQKSLWILLALGIAYLGAGLGVCFFQGLWTRSALALTLLGLFCILFCFLIFKRELRQSGRASQWQRYSFLVFIYILFFTVLVEVNYLASRFNKQWDLTHQKQHTLDEGTVKLIRGLKNDINLTAFFVGLPPKYLEDLLKEYERNSSGRIKTKIIDPIVEISYAAQFGNMISGREKKLIVQSGAERRDIDFTQEPLAEGEINNGIIRVSRKERNAYFLVGHNELNIAQEKDEGMSTFASLLGSNNIRVHKILLGIEDGIPRDCDVLMVAGPKMDLSDKEIKTINDYLDRGGDAFFMIENVVVTTPDKPLTAEEKDKNPSLNNILNRWGINVNTDVVVDLASHASGDVGSPATRNYLTHRSIVKDLDYTFYIRPRSISIRKDRPKTVNLAPMVMTSSEESSWGETNRTLQVKFDKDDKPGPVAIAYAIWEPKREGKNSDTKIIVFTDADFLSNIFIKEYSNAQMGLNVVKWLTESDYEVFLDKKKVEILQLNLTSQQKRVIAVILILMPILVTLSGIIRWIKQNN